MYAVLPVVVLQSTPSRRRVRLLSQFSDSRLDSIQLATAPAHSEIFARDLVIYIDADRVMRTHVQRTGSQWRTSRRIGVMSSYLPRVDQQRDERQR